MKVFISSTVYDLLDLRSVLEKSLRSIGVSAVLSEVSKSAFDVIQDENSIGACLANVASSQAFICMLDKRYGPSLGKCGYDDVSATHLEYRHAKENGLPIHFFVRDRLESDYRIWTKNGRNDEIKYAWCEDVRVFRFLEEHRALNVDSRNSNWVRIFNDAIDLSDTVCEILNRNADEERVLEAIQTNNFPLFTCHLKSEVQGTLRSGTLFVVVSFTNVGRCPAFDFKCFCGYMKTFPTDGILKPGEEVTRILEFQLNEQTSNSCQISNSYKTLFGVEVREDWDLSVDIQHTYPIRVNLNITSSNRRFVKSARPSIRIEELD